MAILASWRPAATEDSVLVSLLSLVDDAEGASKARGGNLPSLITTNAVVWKPGVAASGRTSPVRRRAAAPPKVVPKTPNPSTSSRSDSSLIVVFYAAHTQICASQCTFRARWVLHIVRLVLHLSGVVPRPRLAPRANVADAGLLVDELGCSMAIHLYTFSINSRADQILLRRFLSSV